MTDYIHYLNHILYDPSYYHRDYSHDIESKKNDRPLIANAKRAAQISFLFLSLYRPFATVFSTSMGAIRLATHFQGSIIALNKKDRKELYFQAAQTTLAIAALAGAVFQYRLGLFLTTGSDIFINSIAMINQLDHAEYTQAAYTFFKTFNDALYLSIMITGSLEIVFISYLMQFFVSAYDAKEEWNQSKYPESIAKMIMSTFRLSQAYNQFQFIRQRNFLLALEKFQQLKKRIEQGKDVKHLLNHPLSDLVDQIDEHKVVLTDGQKKEHDFGFHHTGCGKGTVKGMNLTFKNKELDGKKTTELSFKVNHVSRDDLQKIINQTQSCSQDELTNLLQITSHASSMSVKKVQTSFEHESLHGEAYLFSLEGLGKVYIGASDNFPTQYDRVTVHMDEGATLYQLHELLSIFDLHYALQQSLIDDLERMKIGQLFRTFFPKEATPFERCEDFFNLSISDLKEEIIQKCPKMKDLFEKYLPRMKFRETFPGKDRLAIEGLSDELEGSVGLTATVTGAYTDSEVFSRVASILNMGMLSTEQRELNGIHAKGLSSSEDLLNGSSDSVFTRHVSQRDCDTGSPYYGKVRILISNKALENGTYQYLTDNYGTRRLNNDYYWASPFSYLNRPDIFEFVQSRNQAFHPSNEVMIKDRIRSDYIKGLIVNNAITKQSLIQRLKQLDIVQLHPDGHETILGKDIDAFIHVDTTIREEYFA